MPGEDSRRRRRRRNLGELDRDDAAHPVRRDGDEVPDDGWALTLRDALDAKRDAEATAVCTGPVLT